MVTREEADEIASERLVEIQRNCPVEVSINEGITEEHELGYVYFYNAKRYWDTRDFAFSLAGNGPLLVKKDSGEIIVLASNRSVKKSLAALYDY